MGRKSNTFIRDFFVVNDKKAMCKNCGDSYSAQSTTNLKRHLEKKHSEMFNQFEKQNREEASAEYSSSKKRKTNVVKVQVEVCEDTFIQNCINFVTKQNLPFSFFDSKEFKYLTEATFKSLNKDPITSRNIMDYVAEKYNKLKQELIQKMRNRMLCIKIDAATRLNRSVLGINVQVLEENEVKIFTLAMIEIKARHTGENLKAEVERVLNGFFVKKSQIYSITTDNGRNLLKCVDQLSVEAETDWEDQLRAEDRCDILSESFSFDRITSIKCAAHTLQLAVNDFLKESERATIVDQARNVVKILRTTTLGYQLEQNNLRKPPIDVATRWGSTYKMLKGLMELRDFCADNWKTIGSSKELREENWNAIGDVVNVLAPLNELTLKLQNSQLLLGDFYKHWLELICQMEDLNSDMSKKVIHFLRIREKGLLEHDTIYAALFLDPRFRRLISVEKLARASQHLKKLVVKMHHLTQGDATTSVSVMETQEESKKREEQIFDIDESSMQSTSSILRGRIRTMELAASSSSEDDDEEFDKNVRQAYEEIDGYRPKRLDVEEDLLKYWESKKYQHPWLYKLARFVHGVPATQVSVERSFSALRLILSDLRYNISDEHLEKLMFVKLNQ